MNDTATKRLSVTHGDPATIVEFTNPAAKNVMDDVMIGELHAVLDASDDRKVLVFRGRGDGFSAGRPHSPGGHPGGPEAARKALNDVVRLNLRVGKWKAPTVALVHGYAHGAALGLIQQCDIALAERGTVVSFPEITYHLPPGLVASYLRRCVSEKAARYLVMSGRQVDAVRAREMGLISDVVEPGTLHAAGDALIGELAARIEAEIWLKESLAKFNPWQGDLDTLMEQGVGTVFAWGARNKK
ncbi:MAG TPA: enoyl-CoA hydratase/isomerase family protein [Candidatus Binatia bacterium]|nr:enoyl-CoA hydratase/isomerase family protein [Candidatus Binatia bacterium]